MTDALADRCSLLAADVVKLLENAIACQADDAAFEHVVTLSARIRAVAERGTLGIDSPDYIAWADRAPELLGEMEEAALRRDSAAVWAAFTNREAGLHLLGTACAGQPGW